MKRRTRESIQRDVERFLRNGGQIQKVPTGVGAEYEAFDWDQLVEYKKRVRRLCIEKK